MNGKFFCWIWYKTVKKLNFENKVENEVLIKILLFSGEHVLLMLQVRYTSLARVVVLWKTQQWLCKSFRSNFISCNKNCTLILKQKPLWVPLLTVYQIIIGVSNLIYKVIVAIKARLRFQYSLFIKVDFPFRMLYWMHNLCIIWMM
jgi:hypothetical protein